MGTVHTGDLSHGQIMTSDMELLIVCKQKFLRSLTIYRSRENLLSMLIHTV